MIPDNVRKEMIEKSWERIFDIGKDFNDDEKYWLGGSRLLQICIDKIYLNEIVSTKKIN